MPPKQGPRRAAAPRAPSRPEAQPTITGDTGSSNLVIDPALLDISSPLTSPATTNPSPAVVRPPVQRLQSLNRRTPAGSIRPLASVAGDNVGHKPVLKYQPRATTRRSKEERDEIQRLEAERNQERLAEAAAIQKGQGGTAPRGRGGFRRGRGGILGTNVSGPLGASTAGDVAGREARKDPFGVQQGSGPRIPSAPKHGIVRSAVAVGAGLGDVSSDESDSGIRVSIDQMNIESDVELDEQTTEKAKGKKPVIDFTRRKERGLRPIRVERHPHEERVIGVNTEPSINTSTEIQPQAVTDSTVDNVLFVQDDEDIEPREQDPSLKAEPVEDDISLDDVAYHVKETPVVPNTYLSEPPNAIGSTSAGIQISRNLLRTREEIEENERHIYDLESMRDLLLVSTAGPEVVTSGAGDGDILGSKDDVKDRLSGQLFLIQFPPLTPNLVVPGATGAGADETSIPNHGARLDLEGDVIITSSVSRSNALPVKLEEDRAEALKIEDFTPPEPPKLATATLQKLPAGRVGRLDLQASGRVTMDWGGISFELGRATEVDFLQEAVITSSPSPLRVAEEGTGTDDKNVWAMGQLRGKFVVTPDWEELL